MGLYLIGAAWIEWLTSPSHWLVMLEVAAGLGFVIFVHELGHFLVAKACGVKCEKFYLGFDFFGWRIARFQWGETEYGIGVLPLGGYVKMLGQDDNPAKAAEEMERSRAAGQGEAALDPRSYPAQSVPERMAIISAGVIMNLIFAVIMGAVAYSLGVKETVAGISEVIPGAPAWKAGLRPGDEVVEINGIKEPRFRDLMRTVTLGDAAVGVRMKIRRGEEEPFDVSMKPDRDKSRGRALPVIGVRPPLTTTLSTEHPWFEHSPAGDSGKLKDDDQVVKVGDVPVNTFAELHRELALHADEPVKITVERTPKDAKSENGEASKKPGADAAKKTQLEVTIAANRLKGLGFTLKAGPIVALQKDSPAVEAGLREGDAIVKFDGKDAGDPFTLPQRLRRKAGREVALTVQRGGAKGKQEIVKITPRKPTWFETSDDPGGPISIPALGIAFDVMNEVAGVAPGSEAARQGLKRGDALVKAELILADGEETDKEKNRGEMSIEFSDKKLNWPYFYYRLQWLLPGTKVKLTTGDGRTLTLSLIDTGDFNPERGLFTTYRMQTRTAKSVGEAMQLGLRETKETGTQVFQFLGKLGSGDIPLSQLGGPGTIAVVAAQSAQAGPAALLLFLTMLSANLAVINFLPIPVLDGGHMVFLAYEGIRRKPPDEKVAAVLTWLGFAFILSIMLLVIGLDTHKLIQWVSG